MNFFHVPQISSNRMSDVTCVVIGLPSSLQSSLIKSIHRFFGRPLYAVHDHVCLKRIVYYLWLVILKIWPNYRWNQCDKTQPSWSLIVLAYIIPISHCLSCAARPPFHVWHHGPFHSAVPPPGLILNLSSIEWRVFTISSSINTFLCSCTKPVEYSWLQSTFSHRSILLYTATHR